MKPSQIKTECELIYTQIKNLEKRRTRLQSICKHVNTFKVDDYTDEVEIIIQTRMCEDCNKVLSPRWEKLGEINGKKI